uniref:Uncharacterized protein n=1 Tax=Cajanus cajan TaxID=3821 RepID=A0A151RWJ8_CAJCA|nr:hypothetical protein KK1_031499 [Cajanus cajan]
MEQFFSASDRWFGKLLFDSHFFLAKSIVDANPKLFNSEEYLEKNHPEEYREFFRQRRRRPGLGLKLPRFSMKRTKQPLKYRHRYPREASDDVLSSQETLGSQSIDPVAENIDKGVACNTSSDRPSLENSSATEGNKLDLDELLNELLRYNPEDLEGDKAIKILQDRLQIKPIPLEKFSLPDFPDYPVIEMKSLRGNKSKPKSKPRKALSDIDNFLKRLKNRTPLVKAVQCPVQQLDSPTPPRFPFASSSTLQKEISTPSLDSFLPTLNHNNLKDYEQFVLAYDRLQRLQNAKREIEKLLGDDQDNASTTPSNKLNVPGTKNLIAVGETSLADDTIRNSSSTSQKSMVDNSRDPSLDANNDSAGPDINCTHTSEISKEDNYGKSSNLQGILLMLFPTKFCF